MTPEGKPEEDAGKESISSARKKKKGSIWTGSWKWLEGCASHLVTMRNEKLKSDTTKRVTQWAETSTDL